MAKEREVFQHLEGSQGDDAKALGNSRDRFP